MKKYACGVVLLVGFLSGCGATTNATTVVTHSSVPHAGMKTKYEPAPVPKLPTEHYQTNLPVVLLKEQVTSDSPLKPKPPQYVTLDIPPSLHSDFVAYFAYVDPKHPLYIVVPKSMKPSGDELVGQDGSFGFTFTGDDGSTFSVGSSGPCNGCAASAGAGFFAEAEQADEQDGGTKQPSMKEQGANVAYPRDDLALYAYKVQGITAVGFNQYNMDMNKHAWGLDFQATYKGTTPDSDELSWMLNNLIEQNQGTP